MSWAVTRRQWHAIWSRFFVANTLCFFVLSLIYLSAFPDVSQLPLVTSLGRLVAYLFSGLAFLTQSMIFSFVLTALCYGFSWLPLLSWSGLSWSVAAIAVLSGLGLFIFFADAWVFMHYRLHYLGLAWDIYRAGVGNEVLGFTWVEWIKLAGLVALFIFFEAVLLLWLIKRVLTSASLNKWWPRLVALFFAITLASYTVFMKAAFLSLSYNVRVKSNAHLIVMMGQTVPYFDTFLAAVLPIKNSMRLVETAHDTFYVQSRGISRPLHYPLRTLSGKTSSAPKKILLPNIIIIGIDTWRFDAMNEKITPHIYQFAKAQWRFLNHYSGGNSTLPGLFSLFYSIPGSYWTSVLEAQRRPALFDRLAQLHYQIKILTSASLRYPNFAETIFKGVPDLRVDTPGKYTYQRDQRITHDFIDYLKHRKRGSPLFGFLFYDSAHNWCNAPQPYQRPFQPALKVCDRLALSNDMDVTPLLNRYRNAVHFVDKQIGQVLSAIKSQGLLGNTIILITADHGEEFDDTRQKHWFHASAYDRFQLKVPLIIHWPGKQAQVVSYQTTHYDIVPSLMRDVLGVQNVYSDYSIGHSLFVNRPPPVLLAFNYRGYALVAPDRITTFYPGGRYMISNVNNVLLPKAKLNMEHMGYAYRLMTRYFTGGKGQDDQSHT